MLSLLDGSALISVHDCWKTIALTIWAFIGKVMSLLLNTRSRFFIVFLPRSKCLFISWLLSPVAMILEPKKIKSFTVSIVSPFICHEVMGPDAMIFVFWMLSFKPVFFTPQFHCHQEDLQFLFTFCHKMSSACLRLLIFLPEISIPDCVSSILTFLMIYSA